MTTDRRRRRRPAAATRRLVGGASTAAVLALVAAWAAGPEPQTIAPPPAPTRASVRVVITDAAIDTDVAVAAALDAAAHGIDRVAVPVAGSSSRHAEQVTRASHSTTRAS
jgi:hypothetical protein